MSLLESFLSLFLAFSDVMCVQIILQQLHDNKATYAGGRIVLKAHLYRPIMSMYITIYMCFYLIAWNFEILFLNFAKKGFTEA